MKEKKNTTKKTLKDSVFDRIECENVCPKSKLFFKGKELAVWSLWVVSVVVGAFAVAISLFVFLHHRYALYEATHQNMFTFVVDFLPYLWMTVFGLMVFVAVYNLRHTAKGYRYSIWLIVGSSVTLSFVLGVVLQLFGYGYVIDQILGTHMPAYVSQERIERSLWQDPSEGRLLGKQLFSTLVPTSTVIFKDVDGKPWTLQVSELHPEDLEILASKQQVKLLGKILNNESNVFHACGVMVWLPEKEATVARRFKERKEFIDKVAIHNDNEPMLAMRMSKEDSLASSTMLVEKVCPTLMPVRRLQVYNSD